MQLALYFRKWQMYKIIEKVIESVEESKRTYIDNRTREMIKTFMEEETITARTVHDTGIAPSLVRHNQLIDQIKEVERERDIANYNYAVHSNRADDVQILNQELRG